MMAQSRPRLLFSRMKKGKGRREKTYTLVDRDEFSDPLRVTKAGECYRCENILKLELLPIGRSRSFTRKWK